MPSQIVNFAESTSQTRSQKITIPNLKSVTSVTANTGNATFTVSGNEVTINVSNGAYTRYTTSSYTPSQSVTAYQTSGGSGNFPTETYYNSGGYSGYIPATGSPYVISGSYTPGDSKTASSSMGQTGCAGWFCKNGAWTATGSTNFPSYPSTQSYNDGVYSGTLNFSGITGAYGSSKPSGSCIEGNNTQTCDGYRTVNYSGTVYKPAVDTRTWRQDYAGTVYGATQTTYTYYYAYDVTVVYEVHVAPDAPIITAPENGVVWFGINDIEYTPGNDPDTPAHLLQYQIQYSPDGGVNWSDLIALTAAAITSYSYDFAQKPVTSQGKIRVRSYDGINYGAWGESGTFSVVHKSKIGESRIAKNGSTIILPIYDPSVGMAGRDQLRTECKGLIGCYELVDTTDTKASSVRVQTTAGTKAILKE
jgi:hypothetical protein